MLCLYICEKYLKKNNLIIHINKYVLELLIFYLLLMMMMMMMMMTTLITIIIIVGVIIIIFHVFMYTLKC